jgi:Protein of unknown function, DUF547
MNLRHVLSMGLGSFIAVAAVSAVALAAPKAAPKSTYDPTHQSLNLTLQKVVGDTPGKVDYKKLRRDQKGLLAYLKDTSAVTQKVYDTLPEKEKIAFLINAYNAFTLKLVVDNYPIGSIKKISGIFTSPWKLAFFRLLGKNRSLDDVEHQMLRKQFSDPRILFALNSATLSSAPLRNEAYTGDKLDDQLADQTRIFLMDKQQNQFDPVNKTLKLSKLFDWYPEDFKKDGSSVQKFVAPFYVDDEPVNAPLKQALEDGTFTLSYFDFDWNLNDKKE